MAAKDKTMLKTALAEFQFLKPDEKYRTEKPYGFKYPRDCKLIPWSNMSYIHKTVPVTDMRGAEQSFSLETHGFAIFTLEKDLPYEDLHHKAGLELYFRDLEEILQKHLGAKSVKVFRHRVSNSP